MATNLQFKLALEPIGYDNVWPEFYIKIDGVLQDEGILDDGRTYNFDVALAEGVHTINVGLVNKLDQDTVVKDNKIVADKAIIVRPIEIEGYTLDNFMHRAVYYPTGRDKLNSNYLGWNGHWELEFTTPIFTWIHETQHLGWIYGRNI
jgi:hypothetical protein